MSRSKLFESWTYGLKLPIPLDGITQRNYKDVGSRYNLADVVQSTLHAPTLKAILAYVHLKEGAGSGAIGENTSYILAEFEDTIVAYDKSKGIFFASQFALSQQTPQPYTLGAKGGHSGAALIFTLMPILEGDEEFHDALTQFIADYQVNDLTALATDAALLCDNVYRRIIGADSLGEAGIALSLPRTGNILQLTALMLESETYSPSTTFLGTFCHFTPMPSAQSRNDINEPVLAGAFKLMDKTFSPHEQQLIPQIEDWYIVPEEIWTIGNHIQKSSSFNRPVRNIMLRGDSGVGKTAAARAIAAGLQVPYYVLTCHPHMEIYDLVGQLLPAETAKDAENMVPSASSSVDESIFSQDENHHQLVEGPSPEEKIPEDPAAFILPSFEDLLMDPATAMCQITGEAYDENVTAEDAFNALVTAQSNYLAAQKRITSNDPPNTSPSFQFVKSPLIKALESGALIEIQEVTLINDPGVLAGLNNLLEGQPLTLPTGELICRDPNSIVVMTTNVGYAGCKTINQSIISRMQIIIDMKEPTEDEIIQRVMQASGCEEGERNMIKRMTSVFLDIKKHCREKIIQDGSVGMRELIDWAQSYRITKDAYQSALYTIIPSASMEEESREELINTCLSPKIYF